MGVRAKDINRRLTKVLVEFGVQDLNHLAESLELTLHSNLVAVEVLLCFFHESDEGPEAHHLVSHDSKNWGQ